MTPSSNRVVGLERLSIQTDSFLKPASGPSCTSKEPVSNHETDEFFKRNGFDDQMRENCHSFAQSTYPDTEISPVKSQGYCSYTLAIAATHLLQFRSKAHQLDLQIWEEARMIFGNLVPRIQYLGCVPDRHSGSGEGRLHAYIQERIPGVTLEEFRGMDMLNDEMLRRCRRRLIGDLAEMFAISLHHGRSGTGAGDDETFKKGPVGSSIRWRLDLLEKLPDSFLRETASETTSSIDMIESLPWCLTHGDLVPANIMVDPSTGHLTGLIDWAEGEWLPFGVGLYGLEEVLAFEDDALAGFRFCAEHEQLRLAFWNKLVELTIPEVAEPSSWIQDAGVAQRLGILLWRGIAFEDGRIDRVVEAGRDDVELQKLRLFLLLE